MKSQTLNAWLHASASVLACLALLTGVAIHYLDADLQPEELAREHSEFQDSYRIDTGLSNPAQQFTQSENDAQVHQTPASQLSNQAMEKAPHEEVGEKPLPFNPRIHQSSTRSVAQTAPTPRTVDAVYRVAQPDTSEAIYDPSQGKELSFDSQWLKGDGFIVGWDGRRCITAGEIEQPQELSTALAMLSAIAPRNRSSIALASYAERTDSESLYEDSDLWESDQDTGGTSGSGGSKQPDAIGVPPPRPQPQFLRDTSVLLDPGEFQFEYGISYTTNLQTTAIGVNVNDNTIVTSLRTLTRTVSAPMEFRVGCSNDVQAFASLPVGYNLQQISIANTADSNDGIGIGDLTFGMTRVLRKPQTERFTILGNMSASAPTGLAQLSNIQQTPGVALGSGYWTLSSGLVFIRTIDPIAAYIGINYVNTFETKLNNLDLQPGNIFSYRFGVGYAINSRVSISSSFNGAYITELEVGGRTIPGSAREPLTVRLAATILSKGPSLVGPAKGRRKTTEPFIAMGITDAAPDTSFGVRWTY